MGKALSRVKRPLRDFNLESRAHKIISKDKPVPAPRHKSDVEQYEKILREHPEIINETAKKHGILDKNLRDVYVKSHDPEMKHEVPQTVENPDRPLPLNRKAAGDQEFGFHEPTRVGIGKTTLRKALRFISEHQADPKTHNVVKIAEEYLLPEEKVKNILKYFRVYEVYIPEKKVKASFAGPSIPRTVVTVHPKKQLPSGNKDET